MKKKRTIKEVQAEIDQLTKEMPSVFLFSFARRRGKSTIIESQLHLVWLEGYLQALKDERGKK